MKINHRILLVAALFSSSANIISAQELDDDTLVGAGWVTAEPIKGNGNGWVNNFNVSMDETTNSVIDKVLQLELDQLKGKDTIEVRIYLDTTIDEEDDLEVLQPPRMWRILTKLAKPKPPPMTPILIMQSKDYILMTKSLS